MEQHSNFNEYDFKFIPRPTMGTRTMFPVVRYNGASGQLRINKTAMDKAQLETAHQVMIGIDKSRGVLALKPCDAEEYGCVPIWKSKRESAWTLNIRTIAEDMGLAGSKVFEIERTPSMVILKESKRHRPISMTK